MEVETLQQLNVEGFKLADTIKNHHKIIDVRYLSENTFVIRLERKDKVFVPGQHIQLQIPGNPKYREYSVYSGVDDDFIEVLVKEVKEGYLTPMLKKRKQGDYLEMRGPVGHFKLKPADIETKKFLFIASGTGISPFHSFVRSYKGLDYKILHGVRYGYEAYDSNEFETERVVVCTSGDENGTYHGRVTDYLRNHEISKDCLVYLCGNYNMIVECMEILKSNGFNREQLFVESYF
jgi:ferredoxin--NADP+ reductase